MKFCTQEWARGCKEGSKEEAKYSDWIIFENNISLFRFAGSKVQIALINSQLHLMKNETNLTLPNDKTLLHERNIFVRNCQLISIG